MKRTLLLLAILSITRIGIAQSKPADTIVVKIGNASRMVLTIHDKRDLETMKYYNFQALITDLIRRLEEKDTALRPAPAGAYLQENGTGAEPSAATAAPEVAAISSTPAGWPNHERHGRHSSRRTYSAWTFDLGTNNYLQEGSFTDGSNRPYTVRPWGSWFVGVNSTQRTRLAKKLFLEWGLGANWYNFKFQNENIRLSKTSEQITFAEDSRGLDAVKSKLTASFINASFVPVVDFGGNRSKPSLFDETPAEHALRIGAGVYAGYRIGSYSKFVYKDGGDHRKDRDNDNYYLNNLRYGVRVQVGFGDVDVFFNYDLNDFFIKSRGPQLNAFSFGVTI